MRIAVIGAGYVGLTTAACLAHLGNEVRCADLSTQRVEGLLNGELPIVEPGLGQLVQENCSCGRLSFHDDNTVAVTGTEVVFLCVPTPEGPDGHADTRYIEEAARSIAPHLTPGCVVVNKSTVPVGSTVVIELAMGRTDVAVVSNPEFLSEGSAVHDFLHPDRVVIGADDHDAALKVAGLYMDLRAPLVLTTPSSAETIKYASNAFLATKISFANAMTALCEAVGADVDDVLAGMGLDPRIGRQFLRPGPGWGGSCLPKDTAALVRIAEDHGYDFSLLRGVIEVNRQQQRRVADKAVRIAGGSLEGKVVAVLGLTFKAGTDDTRQSPSLAIIRDLLQKGARVRAYDPMVPPATGSEEAPSSQAELRSVDIELAGDVYEAVAGACVAVVATEWDEFRWLQFTKMAELMESPRIIDTRNILPRSALAAAGFQFDGVGVSRR